MSSEREEPAQRWRRGVVTLGQIKLILVTEQQAKSLKSHASILIFIDEFRSI
jgi:hypothetical protein